MYKIIDSDHTQPLAISHDIVIFSDCTWVLHVHGHKVDSTLCPLLGSIPSTLSTKSLVAFLQLLDRLNVCVGQPDSRFVTMVQQKNDTIMSAAGNKTALPQFIGMNRAIQ